MRVRLHAMPRELLHRQCTRDCQGSWVGWGTELPLGPMETLWIQLEGMIAQACGCTLKNGSFCYEVTAYPNRKKTAGASAPQLVPCSCQERSASRQAVPCRLAVPSP